jgi:hypothetical protein
MLFKKIQLYFLNEISTFIAIFATTFFLLIIYDPNI